MNVMVNLIPTCIVSSKINYYRMILLNSEKQCIYMYRGRRRRAAAARVEEESGGGSGGEEKVSLGVTIPPKTKFGGI